MARNKEYEMAIKIAGKVEQSFKSSMGLTQRELQSIARQAAATSSSARNLGSGFGGANKVVNAFSDGAKKALKAVATAATITATAVGGIATAAISVGSEFEAQMSTVESISGATESQMEALSKKAKELGETTKFSATEAGQAMEYMAMAGWKTRDMLGGIDGIMNLAAASGEELGTVSDIVTDAMTAFGMKADEAGRFADVLAQASSNANTNVSLMGETFKYAAPVMGQMGYSVEDTAVAIGLMANSGIKATQAGTSLRGIMTRMAKPTAEVQAAMDTLGVSLEDGHGNMKTFAEVMQDMRKGFGGLKISEEDLNKGLKDLEQKLESGEIESGAYEKAVASLTKRAFGANGALKAQAAASLAGKNALSGLLAIVGASEEDFNKLTEAVNNSSGAAERMSKIRMDNLQGDITLLQSALSGLGIEAYEQMSSALRDGMQGVTELIGFITDTLKENKLVEKIADAVAGWINDIQKSIPTLVRRFGDLKESIAEFSKPFLEVAKWMYSHGDVVASTLIGIGTAIASVRLASKVYEISATFSALAGVLTNPFAVAILGVGAAIGGAAGLAFYIKKCEAEAKKQNLADHFGTISLSLEELDGAAEKILGKKSLEKLNDTLKEFDEVGEIASGIEDTVRELDKMNWKVSVGLKLTKAEKQAYKDDITRYIEDTQKLVEQERYAVSLSVKMLTDGDSELGSGLDNFLAGKQSELKGIGKDLQKAVNDAFEDGLLEPDEEKVIQDLQNQMARITEGIAQSNFNASLEVMAGEYAGGNFDAATFENMQKALQDKVDEMADGYKEALQQSVAALNYQLESGDIAQSEYDSGVDELWAGYRKKLSEAEAKATEFSLNTIKAQYSEELSNASSLIDEIMNQYMGRETDWATSAGQMWDGFISQFQGKLMSRDTEDAINELLKQLEPAEEQLNELASQYRAAGEKVPESVVDGIRQIENLKALAGNEDALWTIIQQKLIGNEEYVALLNEIRGAGGYIPKEIQAGIDGGLNDLSKNTASGVGNALKAGVKEATAGTMDVGLKINTDTAQTNNVLSEQAKNVRVNMLQYLKEQFTSVFDLGVKVHATTSVDAPQPGSPIKPAHNAKGSIIQKPTLSWFAENGPEAAIPLDGSERAKSLWYKAGELLGMYNQSNEGETLATQAEQMLSRDTSSLKASKSLKALEGSEGKTGENIVYSPQITIRGNASKEDIVEANELAQEKFEQMIEKYFRQQKRIAF